MSNTGLIITHGRLLLPGHDDLQDGALRCRGDRITAIGALEPEDGETIHDAAGAIVAPGLVDLGVFAIDKPAFHFGGISRAALMPDQNPPLDHPARVRFAAQSGKPDFWVHPLGAATMALEGELMAEIGLMQAAGARAIATGRRWIRDSGVMLRLMQYCASLELPLVIHAEDPGLSAGAVATSGALATLYGLPQAPAESESIAMARDIALARLSGAKLHFRQVTTAAGLELVRRAKDEGLQISCGVTPAHFMLSELAIGGYRSFARLSPPLRSEQDRHALRAAIADGTIDVIASGHDPHGPEDKRLPFADAAPGMAGAETLLPMGLTLVRDDLISMQRLFELIALNPARILGVEAGALCEGLEADILIFDPERPWQVDSNKMAASAGNTPFDKMPVQGRALSLFKGGRLVDQI